MNSYVATFHTELGALRTQKALAAAGLAPRRAPVPRRLSASCGICVFYDAASPHLSEMDADYAGVYRIVGGEQYETISENE